MTSTLYCTRKGKNTQNTYSSVNSDADDDAPTNDERQEVNETNYEPNTSSRAPKQCFSKNDKATENHELPKTTMGKQKTSARELIGQLDKISREAELNVNTILQEQINDPVLSVVRQWISQETSLRRSHQSYNTRKASCATFSSSTD